MGSKACVRVFKTEVTIRYKRDKIRCVREAGSAFIRRRSGEAAAVHQEPGLCLGYPNADSAKADMLNALACEGKPESFPTGTNARLLQRIAASGSLHRCGQNPFGPCF